MMKSRVRPACAGAWAGLLLVGLLVGCGESEPAPELPEEQAMGVPELGRLGGEIYNQPDRAEEILDSAGLTPEEFEERVRRITNDPVLSREYSRGFEAVARPPLSGAAPGSVGVPDTTADGAAATPPAGPGI